MILIYRRYNVEAMVSLYNYSELEAEKQESNLHRKQDVENTCPRWGYRDYFHEFAKSLCSLSYAYHGCYHPLKPYSKYISDCKNYMKSAKRPVHKNLMRPTLHAVQNVYLERTLKKLKHMHLKVNGVKIRGYYRIWTPFIKLLHLMPVDVLNSSLYCSEHPKRKFYLIFIGVLCGHPLVG